MIRPAQGADLAEIKTLITSILSHEFPIDQSAYTAEDLGHLADSYPPPSSTFLVAEEANRIIGTCAVKAESLKTAILRRLFVDPRYRGQGIGHSLLKEALSFCRAQGFREIVIRTSTRMEQAIRLCRSLSFQEAGRWELGAVILIRFRLKLS